MKTANEGIEMTDTIPYLRQIRDKEQTQYIDGYKYVNRKGIRGCYKVTTH